MLRPEDESHGDAQSEPSSTHLRLSGSEDDYQLLSSVSEQTPFERVRKNDEKPTAEVKRKQADEIKAVNAAERDLAYLITSPGYPKFKKPREEPFNDESQLVLQYFITGPMGVGEGDVQIVPHNTPALLREGTRLSVTALHAAYTSAVWKMFSPLTTDSILAPHVPRFDHYGLQQTQQNTSGHIRTVPTSTSHSRRFAGQQRTNNVGTFSSVGRPHL
jgi:hypothetical protein